VAGISTVDTRVATITDAGVYVRVFNAKRNYKLGNNIKALANYLIKLNNVIDF